MKIRSINLQVFSAEGAMRTEECVDVGDRAVPLWRRCATMAFLPIPFSRWVQNLGDVPYFAWEPDGSFSLCSSTGHGAWRMGGNVWERNGRIAWIDVVGTCDWAGLKRVFSACGWPATPLLVHLNDLRATIEASDVEAMGWDREQLL